MANRRAPVTPSAPDVLGDEGRLRLVGSILANIQQEAYKLELDAAANGLGDDDPAPDRPSVTIEQRRAEHAAAEENVVKRFPAEVEALRARSNGNG